MRRKILVAAAIIFGLILTALLVGPFLVPVPPLTDTRSPQELADADSRFITINDLSVHYKQAGNPSDLNFILLHGFGASTFSFREVIDDFGGDGLTIAYDRPAFGLTERPLPGQWTGPSPYSQSAQVELTIGLMDAFELPQAVLVGNSAGGTVAMLTALEHPERVQALILLNPAVYAGGGSPAWIRPLLGTPQVRHVGPLLVRGIRDSGLDILTAAWHNPDLITPEIIAGYTLPLQAENWDVALFELTVASRESTLAERLSELTLPILVITGDDDRIVPTEQSIRLAGELPNAQLVVIPNCGHVPHEECPTATMQAIDAFLATLP